MNSSVDSNSALAPQLAAAWLGGGIGTLLRFGLLEAFPTDLTSWPWHTFVANVAACVVLGLVLARREKGRASETRTTLLGSGFCGGLSTFSAMQLEVYLMFDAGSGLLALTYLTASIGVGAAMVSLSRRFISRGEDVA